MFLTAKKKNRQNLESNVFERKATHKYGARKFVFTSACVSTRPRAGCLAWAVPIQSLATNVVVYHIPPLATSILVVVAHAVNVDLSTSLPRLSS